MANNQIVTPYDDAGAAAVARATTPLTFAGGQVKASPGRLCRVVVTTAFAGTSGTLTFYDNTSGAASGTPLLVIPTGAAIGTVYVVDLPAANGIWAVNSAMTGGACTVAWS